jgi:hypothetical protein
MTRLRRSVNKIVTDLFHECAFWFVLKHFTGKM